MYPVIGLIFLACESCILAYAANQLLEKRIPVVWTYVVFVGVQTVRRFLEIENEWQIIALTVAFHVLTIFVCYLPDIKKMAVILILYYAITAGCEVLISIIMSLFFGENYYENAIMAIITVALHKLLLFVLAFLFLKLKTAKINVRGMLKYLPIPLVIFLAWIWYYNANYENREIFGQMLAICVLGILTCIFMIGFVQYKGEQKRLVEKLETAHETKWIKKNYDEDLQAMIRRDSRRAHDSRHHLEYLAGLEDIKESQEYIARLLEQEGARLKFTGNFDIDAILSSKQKAARDQGIAFNISGVLPPRIEWLDPIDMVTILGNGLANAIDACGKIEGAEKYINAAFRFDNNLDIRIENSFTEPPKPQKSGWFKSTKKEPGHGIGMESIQTAVDRYQGYMSAETENGRFTLEILLQNTGREAITLAHQDLSI